MFGFKIQVQHNSDRRQRNGFREIKNFINKLKYVISGGTRNGKPGADYRPGTAECRD